jgi:hypothetical protein
VILIYNIAVDLLCRKLQLACKGTQESLIAFNKLDSSFKAQFAELVTSWEYAYNSAMTGQENASSISEIKKAPK